MARTKPSDDIGEARPDSSDDAPTPAPAGQVTNEAPVTTPDTPRPRSARDDQVTLSKVVDGETFTVVTTSRAEVNDLRARGFQVTA